jgi:large subunit ribosomal protein L6
MSRIGKLPVNIPSGVKVNLSGKDMTVEGPKGSLNRTFHAEISIGIADDVITVTRPSDNAYHRSLHGLTRALIQNMIIGVTQGYSKQLELVGVGYRGEMKGKQLLLHVGYSHQVLVGNRQRIGWPYRRSYPLNSSAGTL